MSVSATRGVHSATPSGTWTSIKMGFVGFFLVAVLLADIVQNGSGAGNAPPEVTVTGGRLSGSWMQTRYGRSIAAFWGVPYAAPPVGQLRFQPPSPVKPWTGVRVADKPGSQCLQINVLLGSFTPQGSEDCLYLNVFAPQTVSRATPLPVMVFIHGGGLDSGSGDLYGPEYLMDRDVILVTLNYRLGALGFFSTGDSVIPGNYGMKDMVQALHWVQDNIRAFGGNPGKVTVFGESVGGASVDMLTLSRKTKGLFQQAITMSGTALAPWATYSREQVAEHACKLAARLKCPNASSQQLKDCLMNKPAADLVNVELTLMEWLVHPLVPFRITVEPAGPDAFLDKTPEEAYAAGEAHDVPYITGTLSQEGCFLAVSVLESPNNTKALNDRFLDLAPIMLFTGDFSKQVNDAWYTKLRNFYLGNATIDKSSAFHLMDLITDAMFVPSTLKTVELRAKQPTIKSPVFLYAMEHFSPRSLALTLGAKKADYGMCHVDDLLYLFNIGFVPGKPSAEDEKFSNKLLDMFVSFATTGNPGNSWQRVVHPQKAEYLHITSNAPNMMADFAAQRKALWDRQPPWRNLHTKSNC